MLSQIHDPAASHPFKTGKLLAISEKQRDCSPLLLKTTVSFLFFSFLLSCSFFAVRTRRFISCHTGDHHTPFTVTPHQSTNISHLFFGIGGSVNTWTQRRRYSDLWWNHSYMRGFVWLEGEPDLGDAQGLGSSLLPHRVSENCSRFKYSTSHHAVRLARIVLESFRLGVDGVRWFVMGDDDTVFFPENLVTVLGNYDDREMYYIGGSSESIEQDVLHSYGMAFGGGGIAISYPLAAELASVLDGCLDRYFTFYGSDQRVWACVSELGVPLTRELGFHQIDIRGDTWGLLAAHPLTPLVSLHHLDYVNPLFPTMEKMESLQLLLHAYQKDPARIVQQVFCYDSGRNMTVSVAWGHSVLLYRGKMVAKDLETPLSTFLTWRTRAPGPFLFNTRALDTHPCRRPLVYFLQEAKEVGVGETQTAYQWFMSDTSCEGSPPRTVSVTAPRMEASQWKKAPRRQCCETMKPSGGGDDIIMRVKLKSCGS